MATQSVGVTAIVLFCKTRLFSSTLLPIILPSLLVLQLSSLSLLHPRFYLHSLIPLISAYPSLRLSFINPLMIFTHVLVCVNCILILTLSSFLPSTLCLFPPGLYHSYLEYSIDPSKVRTQDTTTVIAYVSANVYGRYLTWNFVRNNWSLFLER